MLPIDQHIPDIIDALKIHHSLIIKAEPGAGKTTSLPKRLLHVFEKKVLVLEPRRLAAKLSAIKVAGDLGEQVGETVGYQVRFEHLRSSSTKLIYMTEGIFINLWKKDPQLSDISCVILDEFHERNIQSDLALALLYKLLNEKRPDLKIIIMSATIDSQSLEKYLKNAKVFLIPGRTYPIKTQYSPMPEHISPEEHLKSNLIELSQHQEILDILVFQIGIQEIMKNYNFLKSNLDENIFEVIPLSAELPDSMQKQAFAPSTKRKIILATNVAETSITIPGVSAVIDPGFAKIAGYAYWSGMPTLEIKRISQASAIQRAGRAGRERPGIVVRLYSEQDFLQRDQFTLPEIKRMDSTQLILDVLAMLDLQQNKSIEDLIPWFETPESSNIESALKLLTQINAIDQKGLLTVLGKNISNLPIHPRLGAVILAGHTLNIPQLATQAACLISEGYILKNLKEGAFDKQTCDIQYQIDIWNSYKTKPNTIPSYLKKLINLRSLDRVDKLYKSLTHNFSNKSTSSEEDKSLLSLALLHGYPDRVAKKRVMESKNKFDKNKQKTTLYNFCLGRGGKLHESSVLSNNFPEFLISIEATEKIYQKDAAKGTIIQIASAITANLLISDPGKLIRTEIISQYNQEKDINELFTHIYYGNLLLKTEIQTFEQEDMGEILVQQLETHWRTIFSEHDLILYHTKINFLVNHHSKLDYPIFKGEMLTLLFHDISYNKKSILEIKEKSLWEYIWEQLNYEQMLELNELADTFDLDNGKNIKIIYEENKPPQFIGFIQDFYGLTSNPKLYQNRIQPQFILLSPNKRPTQITSDLMGFFSGSYTIVAQELKRRYPKHYWPEHPTKAKPILLNKNVDKIL